MRSSDWSSDVFSSALDAAHIHDHLDAGIRPSVVLMNPPFSAAAHVDGKVADAGLRHIASALARLAEASRLVPIPGASLYPDIPALRDGLVRLQARGRVVGRDSLVPGKSDEQRVYP